MLYTAGSLILIAVIWGATNPFMKKGSNGMNDVKSKSKIGQFLLEIKFLVTNWTYMLPFLINQIGSLMYVVLLQKSALSLAVPVTNSLAAVITAIVGWSLGEQSLSYRSYFGIFLILSGTTFCILDKMYPINIFKLLAYKVILFILLLEISNADIAGWFETARFLMVIARVTAFSYITRQFYRIMAGYDPNNPTDFTLLRESA